MNPNVCFAFARMQPPTIGHEHLIQRLVTLAKENHSQPVVFLSRKEDTKENPVPFVVRRRMLSDAYPDVLFPDLPAVRSPIDAFRWLAGESVERVWWLCGGDRVEKYQPTAERNRTRFKAVEVVSVGSREGEGAVVASGTRQREFAKHGEYEAFLENCPNAFTPEQNFRLYTIIKDFYKGDCYAPSRYSKVSAPVGA